MQTKVRSNSLHFYKNKERNGSRAIRVETLNGREINFSLPISDGLSGGYVDQIISTGFIFDVNENVIGSAYRVSSLSRLIRSAHACSSLLDVNLTLTFNPNMAQLHVIQ